MLAVQLTITDRSTPTPLSIGHAGVSTTSSYGVPIVTAVGHCRSKRCTRDTVSAICRSSWGITTVDSCREDMCLTKSSCPILVLVCTQNRAYTHTQTHLLKHQGQDYTEQLYNYSGGLVMKLTKVQLYNLTTAL